MLEIYRNGTVWGSMECTQTMDTVLFSGYSRDLPPYGVILRVWGLSAGKEPLLIGVAEPEEDRLVIQKKFSKQMLSAMRYYPELPEAYYAGTAPPLVRPQTHDPLLCKLAEQERVVIKQQDNYQVAMCSFDASKEFPFAPMCCLCSIRGGNVYLVWEKETDCLISPFSTNYRNIIEENDEKDSLNM